MGSCQRQRWGHVNFSPFHLFLLHLAHVVHDEPHMHARHGAVCTRNGMVARRPRQTGQDSDGIWPSQGTVATATRDMRRADSDHRF